MRIELVAYGDLEVVSGGNLYDRTLVDHLRRRGHTVDVVSIPRPSYLACLAHNLSPRVAHELSPRNADLVLQDELAHPSLLRANRRHRTVSPRVSIVHHLRSSERRPRLARLLYRHVERLYLDSVDACIYNSATTRDSVERLLGRRLPHIVATPGGDRLSPRLDGETVEARAYEPGPLRLLFVGNLIPRKGLALVLAALHSVPAGSARLEVVGSGIADPAHSRRLVRQARTLGDDGVVFRGGLAEEGLATSYSRSHLLVVPSSWEGFGIVYLEAMGFGLPVLATTAGGAREIVEPGRNGDLVEPADAAGLAKRIATLAADRARLAAWSREALVTFHRFPGWTATCTRIEEFLQSMADLRERRPDDAETKGP